MKITLYCDILYFSLFDDGSNNNGEDTHRNDNSPTVSAQWVELI